MSYLQHISKNRPKQIIKSTIHKCVLNAITDPNPTQYTESGKYIVKTYKSKLVCNMLVYKQFRIAIGEATAKNAPAAGAGQAPTSPVQKPAPAEAGKGGGEGEEQQLIPKLYQNVSNILKG